MKIKNLIFRYALFFLGLMIAALGVAFSTKAGLGTSPVSSVPYSISLVSDGLTFGGWLNLLSLLQISIQVILLRKECKPVEIIIQTILAFAYGYLTNFACLLLKNLQPQNYGEQMFYLILSCFVLGLGIFIQLKGNVAMLPGEAMNRAIGKVGGWSYTNVKIFFDVFYIILSALICFLFLGRLEGVREGSILSAIIIGNIIRWYQKLWDRFWNQKTEQSSKTVS